MDSNGAAAQHLLNCMGNESDAREENRDCEISLAILLVPLDCIMNYTNHKARRSSQDAEIHRCARDSCRDVSKIPFQEALFL